MTNQTIIQAEKGRQEYRIERTFDAHCELVFRAFTEAELLAQWFLPNADHLKIEKMDCHTGGSFRFSHSGPNGMSFGFRGVYHEVTYPACIIQTSEFTGLPHQIEPVLQITRFKENGARQTTVYIHTICPSGDYRDNMMAANMEATLNAGYNKLDTLLGHLIKKGK